jgi:ADP-heptose:LPS heptosyltransferase
MASVLFLAPADLAETVLATGALAHVLRDSAALHLVTMLATDEARPLLRAVPAMRVFMPWEKANTFALAAVVRGLRYDVAIDARGGFPGRIVPASRRIRRAPATILRHRVDEWTESVGADRPLAPTLWLDERAREDAAAIADAAPLLVLAPGGVTANKRWPRERFAAVARRLVGGALEGARVIVLGAAARDAETTRAIVSSLDADGVAARDLGQGLDLLAAAALLERATVCIGNDNALTHIAAAVGAPTLTLFGPTDERVRAPYGPRARTLRGRGLEEIAAHPALDAEAAMGDITTDAVEAAALELLHAGGLR